jgi:hypothetical protein
VAHAIDARRTTARAISSATDHRRRGRDGFGVASVAPGDSVGGALSTSVEVTGLVVFEFLLITRLLE